MNKYMVKVVNLFATIVEVEAENEDAAREKAKEEFHTVNKDRQTFYESTLPPEHWSVITKEKYEELKAKIVSDLEKEGALEKPNDEEPNIIVS